MKAIRVHEYGGSEVLRYEEVADPVPAAGQVLVDVRAIGVNFADIYSRTGQYRPALPWIPGSEAAGVVAEVGPGVDEVDVGDRVAWAAAPAGLPLRYASAADVRDLPAQTYAERAVVPAWRLVQLPDAVTFQIGAAAMLHGLTAQYLASAAYPIRPGECVLVHAGAGGVGLLLTQLAKLRGATVYTTVSTEEKAAISRQAGADDVILYTRDDFAHVVDELTGGAGVAAVYDSVGAMTFEGSLRSLAPRGYLVLFGQSSGPVAPFNLGRLNTGSYFLTRPSLAHYTATRAELLARSSEILTDITAGTLKVRIHGTYTLQQAADAHRELESRRVCGKVVLIPAGL